MEPLLWEARISPPHLLIGFWNGDWLSISLNSYISKTLNTTPLAHYWKEVFSNTPVRQMNSTGVSLQRHSHFTTSFNQQDYQIHDLELCRWGRRMVRQYLCSNSTHPGISSLLLIYELQLTLFVLIDINTFLRTVFEPLLIWLDFRFLSFITLIHQISRNGT